MVGIAKTPAVSTLFDIREGDINPSLPINEREVFHAMVMKVFYVAKRIRPDCLVVVMFLATRALCATHDDADKLNRLLKYINGTQDYGMTLAVTSSNIVQLVAYVDASFGVLWNRRSVSGLYVTLGGGCMLCQSVSQKSN